MANVETRFSTFFQAFWFSAVPSATVRREMFRGSASAFSWVVRVASSGAPCYLFRSELTAGAVTLDLKPYMPKNRQIILYLFGDHAQAQQYYNESASGWTPAEAEIIANAAYLSMIPDVSFTPQQAIRDARHACNPADPASVAAMNASLTFTYGRFTAFNGNVLPELARRAIDGVWVAAPGNPPEWIPPD